MSDEVGQIKDKIDVAELVGEYVQLKPAGVNKKGLCPFHNEKTPSFMVNSERQSWHCFGCSRGGDIFSFLEEMEGMEFKEALKYLADRAGVQLTSYRSDVDSSQRNRIKEINTEAARFFHNFLIKMDASKPAREYLQTRGLREETIEDWQIGYVPEQWELLTQYLLKKGFSIDDLVAAGITIKRDNADVQSGRGFYDRFRGRIMFPIWNIQGEVVGFTGRLLVEKENAGGKYVNTPQTIVYDKSKVIFGLNKAKQEIKSADLIVMVEGQMDVIAVAQAGMKNVVASSGTALTGEQIKILKRYSQNMNMSFDMDEAGQNAAKRGIDMALQAGMNVKVIRIPDKAGKDPDECIRQNPEVWQQAVDQSQEVMQWYLEKVMAGKDLADHRQKQAVVNEILPEIVRIPYAVERDHWLKELASKLSVEVAVLRDDLKRIESKKLKPRAEKAVESKSQIILEKDRFALLAERLFSLVLKYPDSTSILLEEDLAEILTASQYVALYAGIKKGYNIQELREAVKTDEQENLVDILLMQGEWEFSSMGGDDVNKEIRNIVASLKEAGVKKRRQGLQIEIEKAEKAGEAEKLKELIEEFQKLNN